MVQLCRRERSWVCIENPQQYGHSKLVVIFTSFVYSIFEQLIKAVGHGAKVNSETVVVSTITVSVQQAYHEYNPKEDILCPCSDLFCKFVAKGRLKDFEIVLNICLDVVLVSLEAVNDHMHSFRYADVRVVPTREADVQPNVG